MLPLVAWHSNHICDGLLEIVSQILDDILIWETTISLCSSSFSRQLCESTAQLIRGIISTVIPFFLSCSFSYRVFSVWIPSVLPGGLLHLDMCSSDYKFPIENVGPGHFIFSVSVFSSLLIHLTSFFLFAGTGHVSSNRNWDRFFGMRIYVILPRSWLCFTLAIATCHKVATSEFWSVSVWSFMLSLPSPEEAASL